MSHKHNVYIFDYNDIKLILFICHANHAINARPAFNIKCAMNIRAKLPYRDLRNVTF